jgi:hypothetical protein
MHESKVEFFYFLGGARPGSVSGCFKNATSHFLEKLSESLHRTYIELIIRIIRIMNNFPKKIFEYWTP